MTASHVSVDNVDELRAARSEIVRLATDLDELRAELSERTNRMLNAERRAESLSLGLREANTELHQMVAVVHNPAFRERARRLALAVRRRREELAAWEARAHGGDAHAREQVEHVRTIYFGALAVFYESALAAFAIVEGSDPADLASK